MLVETMKIVAIADRNKQKEINILRSNWSEQLSVIINVSYVNMKKTVPNKYNTYTVIVGNPIPVHNFSTRGYSLQFLSSL